MARLFRVPCFPTIKFIRLGIEDKQGLSKLFEQEKFDKVMNLAAQAGVRYSISNPYAYLESNLDGFLNVLEACRHNRVKHLIFCLVQLGLWHEHKSSV